MRKTIYVESPDNEDSPIIVNYYSKQGWYEVADEKRISQLKKQGYIVVE